MRKILNNGMNVINECPQPFGGMHFPTEVNVPNQINYKKLQTNETKSLTYSEVSCKNVEGTGLKNQ